MASEHATTNVNGAALLVTAPATTRAVAMTALAYGSALPALFLNVEETALHSDNADHMDDANVAKTATLIACHTIIRVAMGMIG